MAEPFRLSATFDCVVYAARANSTDCFLQVNLFAVQDMGGTNLQSHLQTIVKHIVANDCLETCYLCAILAVANENFDRF